MNDYLQTITITGIKNGTTVKSSQSIKCPLAVYINWEPLVCVALRNSSSLEQQLDDIIRVASATSQYDNKKEPAQELLPATAIRRTLKRYAVDAVAAAIEDGPTCFDEKSTWKQISRKTYDLWWSSDSRPFNAVSRFSRQLRTHMNKPENVGIYLAEGREVLAVGIVFEYLRKKTGKVNSYNLCMLGRSVVGDNVSGSFGNHQVGAFGNTQPPPGDWSEILNETFLILLLAIVIVVSPHLPHYLQSIKITAIPSNKVAIWFGFVVIASSILIIWEADASTRLIMDTTGYY
jgi:hypothetical protein